MTRLKRQELGSEVARAVPSSLILYMSQVPLGSGEDKDIPLKSIALPTPHTVMDIDKFNVDTVF